MEPCYPTMIGSVLVDDAPSRSVARTVIRYVPASRGTPERPPVAGLSRIPFGEKGEDDDADGAH
jgi:hypothetical protein